MPYPTPTPDTRVPAPEDEWWSRMWADARSRAWRTLVQGLLLDVGAAVVGVLVAEVADVRWTRAYWAAVGLLVAKSAVQAAVAFAARRLVPPRQ